MGERSEGCLPGWSQELGKALAYVCHTNANTVAKVWQHAVNHSWIVCDPIPRIAKYWEYHKRRETNKNETKNKQAPSYQTRPTIPTNQDTISSTSDEPTAPISVKEFAESWNETFKGKLSQVELPLSTTRQRKSQARLNEHPKAEFWEQVFGNILSSQFLLGLANSNGHGKWRCSFDFLIANDTNCVKIYEGQYEA